MPRQTQSKGIAGAIAGLLIAVIPVLINLVSGVDITPDQLSSIGDALNAVLVAAGGLLMGWATVYFAPRNKTIEE